MDLESIERIAKKEFQHQCQYCAYWHTFFSEQGNPTTSGQCKLQIAPYITKYYDTCDKFTPEI